MRGHVAFSLICPGPPCCLDGAALPCPMSLGSVCLSFLLFFYIKAPGPLPTFYPHPHTAVNLSGINAAALLPACASAVSLIKRRGPSVPRLGLLCGRIQG